MQVCQRIKGPTSAPLRIPSAPLRRELEIGADVSWDALWVDIYFTAGNEPLIDPLVAEVSCTARQTYVPGSDCILGDISALGGARGSRTGVSMASVPSWKRGAVFIHVVAFACTGGNLEIRKVRR